MASDVLIEFKVNNSPANYQKQTILSALSGDVDTIKLPTGSAPYETQEGTATKLVFPLDLTKQQDYTIEVPEGYGGPRTLAISLEVGESQTLTGSVEIITPDSDEMTIEVSGPGVVAPFIIDTEAHRGILLRFLVRNGRIWIEAPDIAWVNGPIPEPQ